MAPIRIPRDQALDLIDGVRFPLDEIALIICDGPVAPIFENGETTFFDAAWQIIQNLPSNFEEWDLPSVLVADDNSDICPASITFATCTDSFSLPIYKSNFVDADIANVFNSLPRLGDENFPESVEEQDKLWGEIAQNMRQRALGHLSSYLAQTNEGSTPTWYVSDIARIEEDQVEYLHVAFTSTEDGALATVCCWDEYWNGLEEYEGPRYRTTWKHNSTVHVFRRDAQNNTVYFRLGDEDGHETFCSPSHSFDGIKTFLVESGWIFSEAMENSTTSVGANNNYGRVFGDVNINSAGGRTPAVSPTPHIQPTQQRPGAAVESGIISGNVNISGLAQINGIVQGDVTVPSGSDVNLNGIVQGTVWVNGGTARLFGTISAAAISSGRIEIYGILQSPLRYNGGDVYFHPNSIIG